MDLEVFLLLFEGGPNDGVVPIDNRQYPWPLPGIIPALRGRYIKITETPESVLGPQPLESIWARGASYRWEPDPIPPYTK